MTIFRDKRDKNISSSSQETVNRKNGLFLKNNPNYLKTPEVISDAVKNNGLALQFVSEDRITEQLKI